MPVNNVNTAALEHVLAAARRELHNMQIEVYDPLLSDAENAKAREEISSLDSSIWILERNLNRIST